MTKISGFTFIHNAIESGYPIVEAIRAVQPYVDEIVIVDMQSTDGTRAVLEQMAKSSQFVEKSAQSQTYYQCPIKVINGYWGNKAGETLRQAHSQYIECSGEAIVHFEADEVFDDRLIRSVVSHIKAGTEDILVYRLQLEQNFQRCRWYPEPVHRVFPRLSNTRKEGHTTNRHERAFLLTEKNGYLWDCTNCFRENWFNRIRKQAELRGSLPQYILTPLHTLHKAELTEREAYEWIARGRHWTTTHTPFNIPEILKPLVGLTKYEPRV